MKTKLIALRENVRFLNQKRRKYYHFITSVVSSFTAVINLAFMIVNGVMGIVYRSLWNGSICVYYFLLGFIRLSIVATERKYISAGAEKKTLTEGYTLGRTCC